MIDKKKVLAILLAAGMGSRYEQNYQKKHNRKKDETEENQDPNHKTKNKQFDILAGKPILAYAFESLAECTEIDSIAIALPPSLANTEELNKIVPPNDYPLAHKKLKRVIAGGDTRLQSVSNAIKSLEDEMQDSVVLIHDAARPLISSELVRQHLKALRGNDGAVHALPFTSFLALAEDLPDEDKIKDESIALGNDALRTRKVKQAVNRQDYLSVQTPQVYPLALLRESFDAIASKQLNSVKSPKEKTDTRFVNSFTDEIAVVLNYKPDAQIVLVPGDRSNIKLTYPEDKILLEQLLLLRTKEQ